MYVSWRRNNMLSRVEDEPDASLTAEAAPACAVLDRIEEVLPLERYWDALVARSGSPIQQFAWMRACAETLAAPRPLRVMVVGALPGVQAAAPLVERTDRFGRLDLLGAEELGEPTDIAAAGDRALARLAAGLVRSGRPLFLRRVLAESPVLSTIQRAYGSRGLVITRPSPGSPWIPLDVGFEKPEDLLNPGRRSDLRRARRMAEQMGDMHCEILSPTPSNLEPLLEEAFRVEAASWKGRERTALTCDTQRRLFFRRYASAAARDGILRLCFLRIGRRYAAMQLAVECGDRFWLLKIGYDEEFRRCSPGTLLMVETIRYAVTRGLRAYELLGCPESWTAIWTRRTHPCASLRAYPINTLGLTALAVDFAQRVRRTRHG
jgi:CelD/BcsL family acetyltransferase involved in cellulose biosynthesis